MGASRITAGYGRISVCAHVFGERASLASVCRLLERAGIHEIELLGEPDALERRTVGRTLRSAGVSISALTAASRVATGRDPASPDAARRRATVDHYRRCIDAAETLGCSLVGMAPCAVGRSRLLASAGDEIAWSRDCAREIALYAASAGIDIGVEVLCRYVSRHVNTAEEGLMYVRQLGRENVGLILDLFHMNIEERSLPEAVLASRGWIRNIQVADSNRLGIGHGHMSLRPFVRALRRARYRGPLTFESFPTRTTDTGYSTTERRALERYVLEFKPRLRAAGWS